MIDHKMELHRDQVRRLLKGKGIIVKPDMISKGSVVISMDPKKHKRMMRNASKKMGYKLALSPEEIEMTGGRINLKDIGRKITSGVNNALATYRKDVRPVVGPALKEVVKQTIKQGLPAVAGATATALGQPQLAAPAVMAAKIAADKLADPATNALGKATGAYGLKRKARKRSESPKKREIGGSITTPKPKRTVKPKDDMSNFLGPQHPASNPPQEPKDFAVIRGGSFRPAGSKTTYGSGATGLPTDPIPDRGDFAVVRGGSFKTN